MEVKHHSLRIVIGPGLELIMWSVIINGFGICYTLTVCYLSPVVEIMIILPVMYSTGDVFFTYFMKEQINKKEN